MGLMAKPSHLSRSAFTCNFDHEEDSFQRRGEWMDRALDGCGTTTWDLLLYHSGDAPGTYEHEGMLARAMFAGAEESDCWRAMRREAREIAANKELCAAERYYWVHIFLHECIDYAVRDALLNPDKYAGSTFQRNLKVYIAAQARCGVHNEQPKEQL